MTETLLVRLDDMRGDICLTVRLTKAEWRILTSHANSVESVDQLDASRLADTALFDTLFDRQPQRGTATHVIWIP